jgi:SAM-dependent methyltransferase
MMGGVLPRVFDRRFGVHTMDVVEGAEYAALLDAQGVCSDGCVGHLASEWLTLPRVLRPGDVDERDVFLDVGCGEGRMLVEAATRYRFGRVIGVELCDHISEIAESNLRAAATRLRAPVEIVRADATQFVIPDDVSVVYAYNPFRGDVFAGFLARLCESLERAPRRLRFVYVRPREEGALLGTGRFRRVRAGHGLILGRRVHDHIVLYETL